MTRLALALTVAVLAAAHASAQEPLDVDPSPSDQKVQADPNAQQYLLMQMLDRYDNPKLAIRRKAEQKAEERRGRLASQKWYGHSPLRPTASPVPWTSTYGTSWTSGSYNPYYWVNRMPTTVIRFGGVETLLR